MTRRDPRHGKSPIRGTLGGWFLRWVPVVLVFAILASAVASYRFDLGPRWFGLERASPSADPVQVAPPPGLDLPDVVAPTALALPLEGDGTSPLSRGRVQRALAGALGDADLGPEVFAAVAGLDGPALFSRGDGGAVPASTLKLLTGVAALETLGPEHVFTTQVVSDPAGSGGAARIVLVGGGDPYLAAGRGDPDAYPARADVVTLARATAAALAEQQVRRVRVGYDDSLFSGPAINSAWPADYVPDGVVTPISALWVDEGRGLERDPAVDPAKAAAEAFATALSRRGIAVTGPPQPGQADPDAPSLASVDSAPLAEIVERVLTVSDNEGAEVLLRHVGLAVRGAGSFRAGVRSVLEVLGDLGVTTAGARILDGSGLSRENRLDPHTLVEVLQVAASDEHPELRSVLTGLPVAGFTGSLELRFADVPQQSRGRVRAKTGTLSGVSALAGVATDLDGRPLVFVLMADRVALSDTLDARDALDDLAASLGACHCGV